jgi:hypothetical protein
MGPANICCLNPLNAALNRLVSLAASVQQTRAPKGAEALDLLTKYSACSRPRGTGAVSKPVENGYRYVYVVEQDDSTSQAPI